MVHYKHIGIHKNEECVYFDIVEPIQVINGEILHRQNLTYSGKRFHILVEFCVSNATEQSEARSIKEHFH